MAAMHCGTVVQDNVTDKSHCMHSHKCGARLAVLALMLICNRWLGLAMSDTALLRTPRCSINHDLAPPPNPSSTSLPLTGAASSKVTSATMNLGLEQAAASNPVNRMCRLQMHNRCFVTDTGAPTSSSLSSASRKHLLRMSPTAGPPITRTISAVLPPSSLTGSTCDTWVVSLRSGPARQHDTAQQARDGE